MKSKAVFCSALCFLISSCSDEPEAELVSAQGKKERQSESITQQGVELKTSPEGSETEGELGYDISSRPGSVASTGKKVTENEQRMPNDTEQIKVADSLESTGHDAPFGVEPSWFENLSPRERNRIESLNELPEGISESWFRNQPLEVQVKVLKSDFYWGKINGDVVLGIYSAENGFMSWPESRKLEGEAPNTTGDHLFGYPIVPGVFGDIELQSSF